MPGRFPTAEDISLPNVQGARPVASIDPSGWGRGAEALARSGQKLGSDVQQSAENIVQGNIELDKKKVENGLMDLSTSYIANRNQYSLSNDPADLDNWRKAKADAEQRFNAAIPAPDTYLGQHARGRMGLMAAEENLRINERGHTLANSQAEADTLQDVDNLRTTVTPASVDPSGRPDPTWEEHLVAVHGRIDQRFANGNLTAEQAVKYKQHAASQFAEAQVRAIIQRAQAETNPDTKARLYAMAGDVIGTPLRNTVRTMPIGAASLVSQAETGDSSLGPKALGNVSPDKGGSRSYGFMGLNSASGSAAAFVRDYGAGFGITARPGTPEFDAQWKAAAANQTEAFRNAQTKYFNERIVAAVPAELSRFGVPTDIANDPRVVTYFADRKIQMGEVGTSNIEPAWRGAHGDVPTFLRNMNAIDGTPQQLQRNFGGAIASGVYGPEGHATRLATRLNGALATPVAETGAPAPAVPAGRAMASPVAAGAAPAALPPGAPAPPSATPLPTVPSPPTSSEHPVAPLARAALSAPQIDSLYRHLNQAQYADQIQSQRMEAASERARKDASNDFYAKMFAATQLDPNPAHFPLSPADIISRGPAGSNEIDQATVEKSLELYKALIKSTKEDHDTKEYGSAFLPLLQHIHPTTAYSGYNVTGMPQEFATITDPGQITDYFLSHPDELTVAGHDKLVSMLNANRKSLDDHAANTTRTALLTYAKSRLSFEQDTGPVKIRDPKGEAIFNAQFVPKFEAGYDKWVKDGKDPWQYLSRDNVDSMLKGMRDQRDMHADYLSATGQAVEPPEAPNAPLPAAPQGVDETQWKHLIGTPPTTAQGPMSHDRWGKVVGMLLDDPSPKMMAAFDQFAAPVGLTAKDVLGRLNPAALKAAEMTGNLSIEGESEPGFDVTEMPPGASRPSVAPAGSYEERRTAAVTRAQQQFAQRRQQFRETATAHAEAANEAAMRAGGAVTETPEQIGARLERERLARIEQLKHEEDDLRAQRRGPMGDVADREALEKQVVPKRVEPNLPHMTPPGIDEQLADLDRREAALKRSGLGGAFRAAQQRRIDEQRAQLMERRGPPLDHDAHAEWRDGR